MSNDLTLWYDKPAINWLAALPVGNGRLGGMVFGRVRKEWIQLNEETLWTGHARERINPLARENLDEMRRLIMSGDVRTAQFLGENTMFGTPPTLTTYETLSNLVLLFDGQYDEAVTDYRRELDMETGIASVSYTIEGTHYRRGILASGPDDVVVIRLTADRPAALTLSTAFWRRYDNNYVPQCLSPDLLSLKGRCGLHGVSYEALVKVVTEGGSVADCTDHQVITDADAVTIIVGVASDFRHADYGAKVRATVDAAAGKSWDELRAAHVADHQRLFSRVSLSLELPESQAELAALPTDARLDKVKAGGEDDGLITQVFAYGRYMLQAASRPGTLPTTLQGIWNDTVAPAWDSKFTININEEMHYWSAETTNLAETHHALFDLIDRMRVSGREVARVHYGCRGFVAHHNTDIWADCAPLDNVFCGLWPFGAAWLTLHLWEHYLFAPDEAFLREKAYPILKEAAEFLVDFHIEDEHGRLLAGPTISPENAWKGKDGERLALCMSDTMDVQITRALYQCVIEAAGILGVDDAFAAELKSLLPRLPATRIDPNGRIAEWLDDVEEYEPGHRHNSHLFGLYPDDQITVRGTPDLAEAARNSLEFRIANGGAGPCWSRAWIAGLFARLGDGDELRHHTLEFLRESTDRNLFSMHPPQGSNPVHVFQIDGNLGLTAAIAEGLLQSQAGEIALLPALPAAWKEGKVSGLRARGGFEVDITWADGGLQSATLRSTHGRDCTVVHAAPFEVAMGDKTVRSVEQGGVHVAELATAAGDSLSLRPVAA
ncbi:glycosyl hydrolase family 95 catalytic domain-containing protein [Devosia sp.]|uniref:glycoside hydrolase family 95 protein n=1 Tax=Devosia sp. TaxID=1871048 RepID=UPI003A92B8EB